MPDQGNQLPTTRWRRVLAAVDGLDVAVTVTLCMIAAGLYLLWGLDVALLVGGGLGLALCIAVELVRTAEARRRER